MRLLNYNIISAFGRKDRLKGGVAIFKHNRIGNDVASLNLESKSVPLVCEISGIRVTVDKKRFIDIFGVYRSPNPSAEALDQAFEVISGALDSSSPNSIKLLVGDVNIDCTKASRDKQSLNELLARFGMNRTLLPATRVTPFSATSIDAVCSNLRAEEINVEVLHTGLSDHTGQLSTINVPSLTIASLTSTRRHFNSDNLMQLKVVLAEESWNQVFMENNVDEAYRRFSSIVASSLNHTCPLKKSRSAVKSSKASVYSNEVMEMKRAFLDAHENYLRTGLNEYKLLSSELKRTYDLKLRDLRREHSSHHIINSSNKSKAVWDVINSERCSKSVQDSGVRLLKVHGEDVEDPGKIASHFNCFFSTIAEETIKKSIPPNLQAMTLPAVHITSSLSNLPLTTEQEMIHVIDSLKPKTSYGLDEISSKSLKFCKEELVLPLVHITNLSLLQGIFPTQLKVTKVIPLHKKGSKDDMGNYRPISLVSTVSKVLERIVLTRIVQHIVKNRLLSADQHGFTKNKSTSSAIVDLVEHILDHIEEGKGIVGIFVDLSKAFDCLCHKVILDKLLNMGIQGSALAWFASFLDGRSQIVEIKQINKGTTSTARSPVLPVTRGVPQGSVLGPLLFILFTNDLPSHLKELCRSIMYADDTVLLMDSQTVEDLEVKSYIAVNVAQEYCQKQDLVFNNDKTKQVTFGKFQQIVSEIPELQLTEDVKYLGVIIDEKLSWHQHIDSLCLKLSSALYALRRTKAIGTLEACTSAYSALFESHLRYGICVWGAASKSHLDRVLILQKNAVRILGGLEFRGSCRKSFKDLKILTVVNIYVYEVICLAATNQLTRNKDNHSYNTRHGNNFYLQSHKKASFERKPSYAGTKYFNALPADVKNEDPKVLRRRLLDWLRDRPFYSVSEFQDWRNFVL